MLEINNVSAGYGRHEVIKDVSLTLANGSLTVIIGPNGSGKSTLLKAVTGTADVTKGKVLIDGGTLPKATERATRVSYLPQGSTTPEMTVHELVLHGRFPHLTFPRRLREADRVAAETAMKRMSIEGYDDSLMSTLSGGMRQRAFIAMTLATETDHLLLDEPCTYLDAAGKMSLMELLRELAAEGRAVTAVIHEIDLAMRYADFICVMDGGRVCFIGTPDELYASGIVEKVFGIALGRVKGGYGWCYYYDSMKGSDTCG